MKPRIRKERGGPWWVCMRGFDVACIGIGLTPAAAYRDWKESVMLRANLVRPFGHATDTRNGVLPL